MKKLHIAIAVIIIALAIAGAFLYVSTSRSVELGSSSFALPDKFTVKENVTTGNLSVVHIKKGGTVLSVAEVKDSNDLDGTINAFKESVKDNGDVKIENFNVGDNITAKKVVYRRNLTNNETNKTDNTVATRYYAKKGNTVYFVESKSEKDEAGKGIDALAREIIKSLNKK